MDSKIHALYSLLDSHNHPRLIKDSLKLPGPLPASLRSYSYIKLQKYGEAVSCVKGVFEKGDEGMFRDPSVFQTLLLSLSLLPDAMFGIEEQVKLFTDMLPRGENHPVFLDSYISILLRASITTPSHFPTLFQLSQRLYMLTKHPKYISQACMFLSLCPSSFQSSKSVIVKMLLQKLTTNYEDTKIKLATLSLNLQPSEALSILKNCRSEPANIVDQGTIEELKTVGSAINMKKREICRLCIFYKDKEGEGMSEVIRNLPSEDWAVYKEGIRIAEENNSEETLLKHLASDSREDQLAKLALGTTIDLDKYFYEHGAEGLKEYVSVEECKSVVGNLVQKIKYTGETEETGKYVVRLGEGLKLLKKLGEEVDFEYVKIYDEHEHLSVNESLKKLQVYDNILEAVIHPRSNFESLESTRESFRILNLSVRGQVRSKWNANVGINVIRCLGNWRSMGSQCFVIWNGLRVKQVQTVSLGWIVKPFTASGMWAEMVRFDKDILQFQRDIVRRLGESGKKCLENGCFESFRDVITWWGRRFKRGVRRLEGLSGVVVGSVFGETLGAIDGLYGGDSDGERADMFLERLDEWEGVKEVWNEKEWKGSEFTDERDSLGEVNEEVQSVLTRTGRTLAVTKLACYACRMVGKFKFPKKGKVDKKSTPLAQEVKSVKEKMLELWGREEGRGRITDILTSLTEHFTDVIVSVALNEPEANTKDAADKARSSIADLTTSFNAIPKNLHNTCVLNPELVESLCENVPRFFIPLNAIAVASWRIGKKRKSADIEGLVKTWCECIGLLGRILGEQPKEEEGKETANVLSPESDEGAKFTVGMLLDGNKLTRERVGGVFNELLVATRNSCQLPIEGLE